MMSTKEQARLLSMSAERELVLQAKLDQAIKLLKRILHAETSGDETSAFDDIAVFLKRNEILKEQGR